VIWSACRSHLVGPGDQVAEQVQEGSLGLGLIAFHINQHPEHRFGPAAPHPQECAGLVVIIGQHAPARFDFLARGGRQFPHCSRIGIP